MHVTIIQLTPEKDKFDNYDEGEVFAENQSKFESVDELTEDERDDAINEVVAYLAGVATSGREDGKTWIEVDRSKAIELFRKPFLAYLGKIDALHYNDLRDFATGAHGIEGTLHGLNEAYHFDDGGYVLRYGARAVPISDWLRRIIRDPEEPTRYYAQAAYDAKQ